jgi:hypothetical protein
LDRVGRAAGADAGLAAAADSRLVARLGFPAGPGVRTDPDPDPDPDVDPTAGIGVAAVVGVSLSTPSGSRLDARIAAVGVSAAAGIVSAVRLPSSAGPAAAVGAGIGAVVGVFTGSAFVAGARLGVSAGAGT